MDKIEVPVSLEVEYLGYYHNKKNNCIELYICINGKEETVIKNL